MPLIDFTAAELAAVCHAMSTLGWIPNKHYNATVSAGRKLDAASQGKESPQVQRLRNGGGSRIVLSVDGDKGTRPQRAGVDPAEREAVPDVQASARRRRVVP